MNAILNSAPSALDTLIDSVRHEFSRHYDRPAVLAITAPGRVNVIGEHVDYNGGWVLPAAINRHLVMAVAPRDDGQVRLASQDLPGGLAFCIRDLVPTTENHWGRYVRGVLAGLQDAGYPVCGFDALVGSTIPVGGGLSSSAALEAAAGLAALELMDAEMDPLALAKLCQAAEHKYAGVPCGIMDQAAVLCGEEGHLLHLDCEKETFVQIPFVVTDWSLLIINSGVAHNLADGEYAHRRAACHAVCHRLGLKSLRDLNWNELERAKQELDLPPNLWRCAHHVLSENERTRQTVAALRRRDMAHAGLQLNQSHASLRDDYRVSCRELDFIAATAQEHVDVAGCRMTGGGFGGSCVALVRSEAAESVGSGVAQAFSQHFGHTPAYFVTGAAAGARSVRF